jgi:hypothetical protein
MTDTLPEPPGTLGKAGARLWNSITAEFQVDDVAGKELLFQACSASDRLEQLREAIEQRRGHGRRQAAPPARLGGDHPRLCLPDLGNARLG